MCIYHLEDWKRYPGATVHYETKNTSALQMAEVYKAQGVKNYFFHLALLQPELRFVDARDDNNPVEIKKLIAVEILYNPWYFFREIALAPAMTGIGAMPFELNRGNIAAYWLFFNHQDFGWTQIRQTGKSLSADILWTYLVGFMCRNTNINIVTKDDPLRAANVARVKKIFDCLPDWLNPRTKKDSDNQQDVSVNQYGNILKFFIPGNDDKAAIKLGRGMTTPVYGMDEPPFIRNVHITFESMGSSSDAVQDEAIKKGVPYGAIYTTTAGDLSTTEGKFMYDLFMGGVFFTESMFDCGNEIALKQLVRDNKKGLKPIVYLCMNHRQLGKTDEWLRGKLEKNNSTARVANMDYFNRWGIGGGQVSPLAPELLEVIQNSEREHDHIEFYKGSYMVRWYITHAQRESADYKSRKIIVGMDLSEGINKDGITMVGVCVNSLEVIFTMTINETNVVRFADFVAEFMKRNENCTLIPERKSTAMTVIGMCVLKFIAVGIDPFRRIYNTIVDGPVQENNDDYKMAMGDPNRRTQAFYDRMLKYFGYNTSGSGHHARDNLYLDTLQRAARLATSKVYDAGLISEIGGLEDRGGRIDHSVKGHDDRVIAWLLSIWMVLYSRNLQHYGILRTLGDTKEYKLGQKDIPPPTQQEINRAEDNKELRRQMEVLLTKLEESNSPILSQKYESWLRNLGSRMSEEYSDSQSLNDVIKDAKDARVRKSGQRTGAFYAQRRWAA